VEDEDYAMTNEPKTVREWLRQQSTADFSLHHIARALGISRQEAETWLSAAPTKEALLRLNQLAQYRHLALVDRVWPQVTWLDWRSDRQAVHPVIMLIRDVFGHSLLDYVKRTYGQEAVIAYWDDLEVPPEYDDADLDSEADDPFEGIPEAQMVFNPHLLDEEAGELFVFGSAEAAACFRWLIQSRYNYSNYVGVRTGYTNDLLGIQLAYDLRHVLEESYWAALPPDTLPSYLAIARALQTATVPDAFHEGQLPPLRIVHAATLAADRLEVVQADDESLSITRRDALRFDQQPVHVFVLDPEADQSPAALILTTQAEPGNPECHRKGELYRYLDQSGETMLLALVPGEQAQTVISDLAVAEEVIEETLFGEAYGLHVETGIFCISRINPMFGESAKGPILVYRIPGGYMLQFNAEYRFTPDEMASEMN
jgi:hypothetical protein